MARRRRHTREFKLSAIARMERASDVAGLAAELGVDRGLLYKWNRAFRAEGAAGLRLPGERAPVGGAQRPGASAVVGGEAPAQPSSRIAELERKVAQQALELDFFRAALQHFAPPRRTDGAGGGTGSTP
ncbi:MAG: transposase [Magnetospirillum sp.]|nr:transposase [Magnetospirillum sp.]